VIVLWQNGKGIKNGRVQEERNRGKTKSGTATLPIFLSFNLFYTAGFVLEM
jgi:hypothetical protein